MKKVLKEPRPVYALNIKSEVWIWFEIKWISSVTAVILGRYTMVYISWDFWVSQIPMSRYPRLAVNWAEELKGPDVVSNYGVAFYLIQADSTLLVILVKTEMNLNKVYCSSTHWVTTDVQRNGEGLQTPECLFSGVFSCVFFFWRGVGCWFFSSVVSCFSCRSWSFLAVVIWLMGVRTDKVVYCLHIAGSWVSTVSACCSM